MNLLHFLFFILSLLPFTGAAITTCPSTSPCSPTSPPVHFPFRLQNRSPNRCGYPRFNLSCNNRTQTVLTLPDSGSFSVQEIDYLNQTVWLNDPDGCLPSRLLNGFSTRLSSSPFEARFPRDFTFLNCSANNTVNHVAPMLTWVPCVGPLVGYVPSMFVAGVEKDFTKYGCKVMSRVSIPVASEHASDLNDGVILTWRVPECRSCLARGGTCGLEAGSETVIGCSRSLSNGLPRSAKYGIIIGVGIPSLLCVIVFACYLGGRITAMQGRNPNSEISIASLAAPLPNIRRGLDGPIIASYPKTLLGESRRLPNPSDNTCPICLCEYKSKETLRTIPECGHYFHANCIDEWLKMNGTCPLCRNSPAPSTHHEFISAQR